MLNVRIPEQETELRPRITVVGVGGGGSNAVNNMIRSELQGVEFLVCNSDAQSLKMSLSDRKIQLGANVTRGLGAGARPDVGRAAADEALDEIMGYLEGSNMVFITAGMGGGTGTGGAPVIARAARESGILTVGVVTKPFHFEGAHRMRLAEQGIEELQQYVDTLLIIPNQNLFRVANEKTTFADAFKMADEVLHSGVRGVTDLMVMPGLINLDFADIRTVMSEMGKAMMGTGEATGERRAIDAAEAAINNPLLEDASMQGARGLLVNITGGMDMTLFEVDEAMNRIRDEVDPDANIIFGSTFSPELEGKIRVSVVATGIDAALVGQQVPPKTVGIANDPLSYAARLQAQAQQAQQAAKAAAAPSASGNFGRGVTIRSGTTTTTNATAATQVSTAPAQRTGTTNMSAAPQSPRAAAMAQNPGFFGRAATAAAVRVEEPVTIADLEEEVYEEPVVASPSTAHQQRGERDGDYFIPPAAVMTESKPVSATASFAGSTPSSKATPQQQAPRTELFSDAEAPVASSQKPQTVEKRQGGFFERFTSGSTRPVQQQASAPQPSQPTLTVDNSDRMPSTPSLEDDLEIPAFLRRQAN